MGNWTATDLVKHLKRTKEGKAAAPAPRKRPELAHNAITGKEKILVAFLMHHGISPPIFEWYFHKSREWRFDIAWPEQLVALEVQGGIWSEGAHVQGARLLKEWEKLNTAAGLGWRVLFCQPEDLCKSQTARELKTALEWVGEWKA